MHILAFLASEKSPKKRTAATTLRFSLHKTEPILQNRNKSEKTLRIFIQVAQI